MDSTEAKIGRLIKNRENTCNSPRAQPVVVGGLLVPRLCLGTHPRLRLVRQSLRCSGFPGRAWEPGGHFFSANFALPSWACASLGFSFPLAAASSPLDTGCPPWLAPFGLTTIMRSSCCAPFPCSTALRSATGAGGLPFAAVRERCSGA